MNRGFGFYFGNAMKSSAKTIWKRGNIFRFFVYFIMEFLARITVIFSAIFDVANVRQAKIAQKSNELDIPQSFKIACRKGSLRTMIMCIIVEALIFIAGMLLICVASGILGALGFMISCFVDSVDPVLLIGIFLAPGGLAMLVYFIIMPLMFVPTPYIIDTNPDIGTADVISICFDTMKSKGKFTYFLNFFIPALVEGAIISVGVCSVILIDIFLYEDVFLAVPLTVIVSLVTFIAFALVAPMFCLARRIANKSLFEDIVTDPVNASYRTNGVNIKRCKGVKFDPAAIENELTALFDETYEDSIPVPLPPAEIRRRQREAKIKVKEERRAQAAAPVQQVAVSKTVQAPATAAPVQPAPQDEDEELITVSGLIGEVEESPARSSENAEAAELNRPAEEARQAVEEPVIKTETTPEAEKAPEEAVAPAEEPTAQITDDTAVNKTDAKVVDEPENAAEAEQPVHQEAAMETSAEESAKEVVKETKPVKKTSSSKTSAGKTTASKTTASKTASKTAASKTAANKTAAPKAASKTGAGKTATKTASSKSTVSKTSSAASKTSSAAKKKTVGEKTEEPNE
ncbi:MAG: hypothetical protein HFE40_05190 [Clostridia bacterium]|nr:hypothetical protein [Clostridia bacterium]